MHENIWRKIVSLSAVDRFLAVLLCLGTVVSIYSLTKGVFGVSDVKVEYLESTLGTVGDNTRRIMVDVEGAVMSAGVLELPLGSRIKDALVASGGFSEKADREYAQKNLNLAQELKDGQKIYIPFVSDTPTDTGYAEAKTAENKVNVNTASIGELDTLVGVGPARAETIIKNRPYGSLEEIVSKGGLTQSIFDKNADRLSVF